MGVESGRTPGAPDRNVETAATGGCSDEKALSHSSCRSGADRQPECSDDLGGGQWPREQETLSEVALEGPEDLQLLCGLYAFGHHFEPESMSQVDHRRDDL